MEQNEIRSRTFRSVLKDKFLNYVSVKTMSHLFRQIGKAFLVILLSGLTINSRLVVTYIHSVLFAYQAILFNLIWWSVVVYNWSRIWKALSWFGRIFKNAFQPNEESGEVQMFENVPVGEWLEVLKSGNFSRKDVCEYLDIGRKKYEEIMKAFIDTKILGRGKNNAIIREMSVDDIEMLFTKCDSIQKLKELCDLGIFEAVSPSVFAWKKIGE